jgi:hypothetical protein
MRCKTIVEEIRVCAKEKKAMSKEKIIAELILEENQKIMMDPTIIDVYTRE